jgi:uncharacterized protein YcbX
VTARVAWLSFTPIKATHMHLVDELDLLQSGVRSDRRFYLVDENGRLFNDKDHGPLQLVEADYDEDTDSLRVRFPAGPELAAAVERGEEIETSFYRQPRPARVVRGPWTEALGDFTGRSIRLVESDRQAQDRGRSGAATILGVASLERLAQELGVESVDPRRFRMNIGIEGLDAHAEERWRGRRVRVGEAVLIPQGNVGRCAVTTQSPETGRPDLDTLKALATYRGHEETTEPLPFGAHAAVVQPGRIRLGDSVEPLGDSHTAQ